MSRLSKTTKHRLKTAFFSLVAAGFLLCAGVLVWAASLQLPTFEDFAARKVEQSTKIYDRTGTTVLYNIHNDIKRKVVPFDQISKDIKNATISIEDNNFYTHHGIEPTSILRAILADLRSGSIAQGGSTITQQVVKNVLLTQQQTFQRKLKEVFLSLKLERELSKDQIFELYLNESPYGGTIYGVEEAAQTYFGKSAKDVDLAESAFIAAIPKSPTRYSPYGTHMGDLVTRKDLVLTKMADLGYITKDQMTAAQQEKVTFLPLSDSSIKAAHFSMMIKDYLEEKYGKDMLDTGGLKIISTLDWNLQKQAEAIVRDFAAKNEVQFNAHNAAMVGIDPKTGQILVMVGSRDYFDTKNDGTFNIALAQRQPGSSFKPFVYATAFKKGYTPDTALFDVKTQFSTNCDGDGVPLAGYTVADCYMPVNYDGTFEGPITIRRALGESRNVPAIKTLYLVGIKNALSTAQDLGITSLTDPNRYGLTLVLGGGEVSPLEMTSAYSVFANDGVRNPAVSILRVEDAQGNVLEEYKDNSTVALEPNIARQINDILSDDVARSGEYGRNSLLTIPGKTVAAKTGTTNDYRDAWIIGYTPSISVGAWVGNNDNSPMEKKIAGFIVAPMWNAFMKVALATSTDEPFKKPDPISPTIKPVLRGIWQNGGETFTVDKTTGKLATEFTPPEAREERYVPNVHEILYWVNKSDPLGPVPTHPESDPQFALWEQGVQKWVADHATSTLITTSTKPTSFDDIHTATSSPLISITSPDKAITYDPANRLTISWNQQTTSLSHQIVEAEYYFNGVYIGSSESAPFSFVFVPADTGLVRANSTIRVVVKDSFGNKGETTVPVVFKNAAAVGN